MKEERKYCKEGEQEEKNAGNGKKESNERKEEMK